MARNLRLQVMLNAVDRVTGPLKRIREGAGKTGQAMRETRDQLRDLQRQQSDLTSYRKANAAMRTNTRAMRDARERNRQYTQALEQQREAHAGIKSGLTVARREYDRLAKQLLNTKQPSDQLTASLERARVRLHGQQTEFDRSARAMREYRNRTRNADEEVKKLTRNHATQTERVRGLKTRLDEAGISTDNLGRSARELRNREDRLNTSLQEQKRHLADVASRQRQLNQARDRYQNSMGNVARMQGVGAGMLGTGMAKGYAASRLLTPGVAWGEQMSALRAVGGYAEDDERYLALRQQSRDLGASTAFSANEVGAGQEFLMRAGMSSDAIKASMDDVLALALANNTELSRAADIASNIGSSFKVDLEGEGEFARVADILSGTARRTNVNLEMLGETFKYLGGLSTLDISLEQAAAITGLMGNIGIQGTMAGTAGRALGERLAAPTDKAAGLMQEYGIEVANAQGGMRDLEDILGDVYQATKDMGSVQRASILKEIFGTTAGTGISEVIDQQGGGGLAELLAELRNNSGENAEMARVMADNLGGDLKSLRSAWEEVGISITDTNEGPLRELVQNITTITRGVGDWIKANPELAGTIAKVVGSLIALATVGGAVTMMMASILGPLLFTRFAMTTLGIRIGWLTKGFSGMGTALAGMKTAMVPMLGALKGLGAAIMATPIGWLVAGIAALITAGLAIYKYWEPITAFFTGFWQGLKDAMGPAVSEIGGAVSSLLSIFAPFQPMFDLIGQTVKSVWGWFAQLLTPVELTADQFEAAANAGRIFGDALGGLINIAANVNRQFVEFGVNIVTGLVKGILSGIQYVIDAIVKLATSIIDWFRKPLEINSPSRVFEGFGVNIVEGIISGIGSMIGALRDHVMGMASSIAGWVQDAMSSAWDSIGDGASRAMQWGKDTAAGMGQGIRNGANRATESAANLASDVTNTARDWLRIRSPSRVFATIGQFVSQGLASGIKDDADSPLKQVRSLATSLRNAAGGLMLGAGMATTANAANIDTSGIQIDVRPPLQSHASEPQSGGLHIHGDINISVQAAPGMDEKALARLVGQEVERALRDKERRAAAANRRNFYDNN